MYELGIFIAFLIGLFRSAVVFYTINSTLAKNLQKVEAYFSLTRGDFSRTNPLTSLNFIIFGIWHLAVGPIFSWLGVAITVIKIVTSLVVRVREPEAVKTLRFKLQVQDLNREDIEKIQLELDKLLKP